jgi:HAD superfamily hydrolase (TIGR01549 family)
VLFDLDGTLRFNRPSSTDAFYDYAVTLGLPDGPQKRLSALRWTHFYWAQSAELVSDTQAYPDGDPFWRHYAERALLAFDCLPEQARLLAPEIHRYMKEEHKPENWVPPDVPETLQALRLGGYRLGVLSNRREPIYAELAQLGLLEYFDLALVAGEVCSWKPDPQIFFHALQRMGVTADQTLYVGDNYYADIVGAQQAGLHPVLLDPQGVFPEAECTVIESIGQLIERCALRLPGSTLASAG